VLRASKIEHLLWVFKLILSIPFSASTFHGAKGLKRLSDLLNATTNTH